MYHSADGHLVLNRQKIAMRYLKGWFLLDLFSTVPLDMIIQLAAGSQSAALQSLKLLKSLRLFRLLKLFRIFRLTRLASSLDFDYFNQYFTKLLGVMGKIMLCAHFLSCSWYSFYSYNKDSINWLDYHGGIENSSPYLESLYWVTGSMMSVGYGDVWAVTDWERLFSIVTQGIGALSVGYIIASITMLFENRNPQSRERKTKTEALKQFLRFKQVPKKLRQKILAHFDFHWGHRSVFNELSLLRTLPRSLKYEIIKASKGNIVRQFKMFQVGSVDFLLEVLPSLRPILVARNQILIDTGTVADEVYFIAEGYLESFCQEDPNDTEDDQVLVGVYGPSSLIGLDSVMTSHSYCLTIRAITKSHTYSLSRESLHRGLRQCKPAREKIDEILPQIARAYQQVIESPTCVTGKLKHKRDIVLGGENAVAYVDLPIAVVDILNRQVSAKAPQGDPSARSTRRMSLTDYFTVEDKTTGISTKLMIDHTSPLKMVWDIIVGLIVLAGALVIPVRICFSLASSTGWTIYDIITDVLLAADIIVSFRTTFIDVDGLTVSASKPVAMNYLKGMFVIDFVSTLPIDKIVEGFVQGDAEGLRSLKLIRTVRLVRLLKLIRLLKLKKLASVLEDDLEVNPDSFRLGKLILPMFFIAHYFGCFWYFVSIDQETSWWKGIPLDDVNSLTSRYIASLYWAFTTMTTVGYGDITPTNADEKAYSILIMMLGATVFAFIVGSVSAAASNVTSTSGRVEVRLTRMSEYLAERQLPKRIQRFCRHHLRQLMEHESPYDEKSVMEVLPTAMRHDLILYLHQPSIAKIAIFNHQPKWFVAYVMQFMKLGSYAHNDHVLLRGDIANGIYFIISGMLRVIDSSAGDHRKISPLDMTQNSVVKAGQFIGYRELLRGCRQQKTLVAVESCMIYVLPKTEMDTITRTLGYVGETLRKALKDAIFHQESQPGFDREAFGLWAVHRDSARAYDILEEMSYDEFDPEEAKVQRISGYLTKFSLNMIRAQKQKKNKVYAAADDDDVDAERIFQKSEQIVQESVKSRRAGASLLKFKK